MNGLAAIAKSCAFLATSKNRLPITGRAISAQLKPNRVSCFAEVICRLPATGQFLQGKDQAMQSSAYNQKLAFHP
jgi:hypothetical protein